MSPGREALFATVGVSEQGSGATLVTLDSSGVLLDRRHVELVDQGLSTHPHHHEGSWAVGRYLGTPGARKLSLPDAVALVERVRDSASRRAQTSLDSLAAAVPLPIAGIALRACPVIPPTIEERIRDHRAQTVADSVMYREALAAAARRLGWHVHWYDRATVFDEASAALRVADVHGFLRALGRAAGPPWRAVHRLAAAAALASAGASPWP